MKCKNPRCNKDALSQRWYCGRDCAPYGHFAGESRISSGSPTKRFYTQTHGETSQLSSDDLKTWMKRKKKDAEEIQKIITTDTSQLSGRKQERDGIVNPSLGGRLNPKKECLLPIKTQNKDVIKRDLIMPKTETIDCDLLPKTDAKEILPLDLRKSSLDIDEVRSESLNLIRSSGERLSELMKSQKLKPLEICACADQLHKLIRLNLDIIKQIR